MRPPHIHFRIVAPNHRTLTTQMYFDGEDLNLRDRILLGLSPAQRKLVVIPFEPADARETLAGRFDIALGDPRDQAATPELD